MKPSKAHAIAALFLDGETLDRISELGLTDGWTRKDAQRVAADNGWTPLDWNGRIDAKYRDEELESCGDLVAMIKVGIDHEIPYIAELARSVEKKIAQLRRALIRQEERDTQYADDRDRRHEEAVRRVQTEPRKIDHGSWSGYQTHQATGTPLCAPCEAAGQAILQRAQQASARARRERHRGAEGVAS